MRTFKTNSAIAAMLLFFYLTSCSSSNGINKDIAGKYASSGDNEFDNFKDTLEIRPLEDGRFDVQTIASWSAAKESDPHRPVNQVAGVWSKGEIGRTVVAELQLSDTTLRITDPLVAGLKFTPSKLTRKP